VAISLGDRSPCPSCGTTGRVDGPPQTASFGLAPDGVYPASASPRTRCALTAPFHPGRQWRWYVSVALSVGSLRPAVSRHRCPAESGLSSAPSVRGRETAATRMTSSLHYSISRRDALRAQQDILRHESRNRWTGPSEFAERKPLPRPLSEAESGACDVGSPVAHTRSEQPAWHPTPAQLYEGASKRNFRSSSNPHICSRHRNHDGIINP
jgi:hypothetical protein